MKPRLLHYEQRDQPLLPRRQFAARQAWHLLAGLILLTASLGIGILGYHFFEGFSWVDSLLNASMILGGMGEVNPLVTTGGKVFASVYSLFSGMIFLVVAGVIVAPGVHRVLHRMHLESGSEK